MRTRIFLALAAMLLATGGCLSDAVLGPEGFSPQGRSTSEGQNLAVSGAGLMVQPSRVQIDIPVQDPADILEATFFWAGRASDPGGDDTILIDGVPRTGALVDSQDMGGDEGWLFFYRLDGMGIVFPGSHDYIVSGFDPGGQRKGGIALAVVYRDPSSPWSRVRTIEPQEIVRSDLPGHENGSVWSFPVQPTDEIRLAKLTVVAADCESSRPDRIWYGAGSGAEPAGDLAGAVPGVFNNLLRSAYGPWLDIVIRPNLLLPPGAGHFAYQLESPEDGDSIVHLFGAVCIEGDEAPVAVAPGCFFGPGFWKHQFDVSLGENPGYQHFSDWELAMLLDVATSTTSSKMGGDDGEISFEEAAAILDTHGPVPPCDKALRQYLATLLNFGVNGADRLVEVDADGDGIRERSFGEAIDEIEWMLTGADESFRSCGDAKSLAESINSMGSMNCRMEIASE